MATSTAVAAPAQSTRKGLRIALWTVQILLAAGFGFGGAMKAFAPAEVLMTNIPWAGDVPLALIRFIGVSEVAGAIGLILPAATRVRPRLTALAALGLLTVMVLAFGFHVVRGELSVTPWNVVYGACAAFVAWGRYRGAPIAPR